MAPNSVFISGCNRGIGLELVKQFLKAENPPKHLFATCRDLSKAAELVDLSKTHPNLHVLQLDVTDHSAYDRIVQDIAKEVGEEGLNLVINNAGILPSERTEGLNAQMMRDAYEVNCIAPIFLTKALLPLIKMAAAKNASAPIGTNKAAVVMMSTAVASIAENSGGGIYAYRCSKTAQNMAMKNLSVELKSESVLVMAMHPGWVQTEMGGPNGQIDTETCCTGMLKTLEGLSEKDHGSFLRYNNTAIQW